MPKPTVVRDFGQQHFPPKPLDGRFLAQWERGVTQMKHAINFDKDQTALDYLRLFCVTEEKHQRFIPCPCGWVLWVRGDWKIGEPTSIYGD